MIDKSLRFWLKVLTWMLFIYYALYIGDYLHRTYMNYQRAKYGIAPR